MIISLMALALSAFLASTLIPFPSEGALILFVSKFNYPLLALFVATLANTLGSLTGYYLGYLGRGALASKYLKVDLQKAQALVQKYESIPALLAFLCFLPIVGDLLSVGLGLIKYSIKKAVLFITLGKLVRYSFILVGYYKILE